MKVTILTPVQAGTDRHDVGDVVDFSKAAALQLIDCGAAELYDPEAARAAKAAAEAEAKAKAAEAEAEANSKAA